MPRAYSRVKMLIRTWFTCRRRHSTRISKGRVKPCIELLEDRLAPATLSDGGTVILNIALAAGENLAIVSKGTSYTFSSNQRFSSASGTDPAIPGTAFSGLGAQALTLTSAGLAHYTGINITDAGKMASVTFNDSGGNRYATNFKIALTNAAAGAITFNGSSDFGTANLQASTTFGIQVNSGASLTSSSGNLTLAANQQANPTSGEFNGVTVDNATIRCTGTGQITIQGQGGTTGFVGAYGVYVKNGGAILGGTGPLSITGTGGGERGGSVFGVFITGQVPNSTTILPTIITSSGGNVSVTGQGGGLDTSVGVYVASGGQISAGGAGTVTVKGTGGTPINFNSGADYGVYLVGATKNSAVITSSGGNVQITGQGGGTPNGGTNYGVFVDGGGEITAGGLGDVTLAGTGGPDGEGVTVFGSNGTVANVTSGGGNVQVTGQGGAGDHAGVYIGTGGQVSAGGGGNVTVSGNGANNPLGSDSFSAFGVYLSGQTTDSAVITSSGGHVQVTGVGGVSGVGGSHGVYVASGGLITAGGHGAVAVSGTGGASDSGSCYGVLVGGAIKSGGGDVQVNGLGGVGGGGNAYDIGVVVGTGGQVTAGSSGAVAVNGTGAPKGTNDFGVLLNGLITSSGGDVQVTGTGGADNGNSSNNCGVRLEVGGEITAGGPGNVAVTGTGGLTAGGGDSGVVFSTFHGGSPTITSGGGNVQVIGKVSSPGASNLGIALDSGSQINTAGAGSLTVFADSMVLPPASLDVGTGTVTLAPLTSGTSINVGGSDAVGVLGLSNAELGTITAGTLRIGNAQSGPITVSAPLTTPTGTSVDLISGADITFNPGSISTRGGALSLAPGIAGAVRPSSSGIDVNVAPAALAFAVGANLALAINGTQADSQYGQLNVTGDINLTGVNLLLTGALQPAAGQTLTLVKNNNNHPIIGTFNGLPEGAVIANFLGSPFNAVISYVGGTGHDVVLRVQAPANQTVTQLVATNFSATGITAGGSLTFTLKAEDATGHVVPTYTGTVQLASSDANATDNGAPLPTKYTFTSSDAGAHTFTVTLLSAGNQFIAVTDQTNSNLAINVGPIAVAAGPFSKFLVTPLGGPVVAAGSSFLVVAQATDAYGNPVAGPSSATLTSTPPDPPGNLPLTGKLDALGAGYFLVTAKTAGAYALTATAGTFRGTSGSLTVAPSDATYFTVSAPASATAGSPVNVVVTAFDHFGNIASGYTGTIKLTSTGPAAATLVSGYTFTSGSGKDNGVHTFSVILKTGGTQTITATDTVSTNPGITGTSSPVMTRGLTVTGFTPTASGFTVTFSKPIVTSNISLFGGTTANPIHNVSLIGKNTAATWGPVNGTLVVDPAATSATFKASSDWLQNIAGQANGLLPNDTWTVTLESGTGTGSSANGFFDALGEPLDGGYDGGHANYTTTFATNNDGKPALTIPDFARGPDGSSTIKLPNNFNQGIPVTLAAAPAGTKDVVFTFNYNPALLTPTGAGTSDSSGTGTTLTMGTPANGAVTFTWHNSTGLTGDMVLGDILANVPNSAANLYRGKQLLTLTGIKVNGADFTGATAPAVHINAYLGDLSGDGQITGLDLASAINVASGQPTSPVGLAAYKLIDPGMIGDIGSNGAIDSTAISSLAAFLVHVATPAIPTPPSGLTIAPGGPDPVLSLGPVGRIANPSCLGIINVPVFLDHARPDGSTGMTEAILGVAYDPKALTVSAADITLGSLPAAGTGWRLESLVDAATGQIAIDLYSTTALTQAQAGSLVNIAFRTVPGVNTPATTVQLVSSVSPQGHWFSTEVVDAENKFVLSPGTLTVTVDSR